MKRQLVWIVRGAGRTQTAFDEQGAAIRELQQQLADAQLAIARIDGNAARVTEVSNEVAGRLDSLAERVDLLNAKVDQIDSTVNELVRVVAPPSSD
jgi:methyl-accepting chemotaxis protein